MPSGSIRKVVNISSLRPVCKECSLQELCLPLGIDDQGLEQLDEIIKRKRPMNRHDALYRMNDQFQSVYALRTGSIKTYTLSDSGIEQITGFYLPGELLGLDAISDGIHPSTATALESTSVCEIPFDRLEEVAHQVPGLQHQLLRVMSRELQSEEIAMSRLANKSAEVRLAGFLLNLSRRFKERGFSPREFNLSMSRNDIANYLGLAVETVSRLFTRFQSQGLLEVQRKLVHLNDLDALAKIAGFDGQEECLAHHR